MPNGDGDGGSSEEHMCPVLIYSLFLSTNIWISILIFNGVHSPIMGIILRAGMDDGKGMGSWHMPKGKGKGTGRRPVPLGPRPMPPTVPPRPKLMPTSVRHGGAWMQCFLWVPFQPGASPTMPPPVSPLGAPLPPPPPQTSAPTTPAATPPAEAVVPEGTGPAAREETGHTGPEECPTEEDDGDYAEEDCGSQTCVFELFFWFNVVHLLHALAM